MKRLLKGEPLLASIALAISCLAGCASSSSDDAAWEERAASARHALIAAGDPDSLSAAALLGGSFGRHDPDRLELIHRAAVSAPGRFDLAWLDYQLCAQDKSCDPTPLLGRLQGLDPRNAVSWVGEISREGEISGEPRLDAAISMMAESDHFDTAWIPVTRNVANAIDRTKTMDSASAVIAAGASAALIIPAYQHISNACKGDALKRQQRLNDCRRLAAVMRRGDTLITEMIGIAITRRVWPEDSDEYREASRNRRIKRYQMAMVGEATNRHSWDAAFADKYRGWLATCKSEQDLLVAQLRDVGIEPDPPSNWKEPTRPTN